MDFKVSIIIPVYNLENYIVRTLDSVCCQITANVELIIVDDGSKDNSLKRIYDYFEVHNISNVTILTGENKGCVSARNKGISYARGEYLYFLDGDDIMYEGILNDSLILLTNKNPDALIGKYQKINKEGVVLYSYDDKYITPNDDDLSSNYILEQCLLKNIVMLIGTVFYSKKVLDSTDLIFEDKKYSETYGEDVEFYFRFLANASNISFLDKNILGYTVRSGSAINSVDEKPLEILQNYITRMLSLKEELANKVPDNILRLFNSTLLPGLILSLSISAYYNNIKVPRLIINRLMDVSFKDTVMKKNKRGLGLYLGSLGLYISPSFFVFLLKTLKIKKRF